MKIFPAGMGSQENAVEQMTRVLEHPRAVAGALMADHQQGGGRK